MKLVSKIATGYRGYGLPLSELIAEGNLGVIQALKHFDPDRGFRFSTYAMWWIKATIKDYVMKTWSLVKIGTNTDQKKLFFNLRRLHDVEEGWDRFLTPEKIQSIATKLKVKAEEVVNMYQRLSHSGDFSLNSPMKSDSDEGRDWIDWIADDDLTPESKAIEENHIRYQHKIIEEALKGLNEREHRIFLQRRLTDPSKTLEDLSFEYGISKERVRQIENRAFEKVKEALKSYTPSAA